MLLNINFVFGLCFLIALSVIDFLTYNKKSGYIPAILTTIFLILAVIIAGEKSIFIGIVISLIALFFAEQDLFGGIADLKILIASGILFPNLFSMLTFAVIVSVVAVAVKSFIYFKITKKRNWKFPFIPLMLISFIITIGLIYVGILK